MLGNRTCPWTEPQLVANSDPDDVASGRHIGCIFEIGELDVRDGYSVVVLGSFNHDVVGLDICSYMCKPVEVGGLGLSCLRKWGE
jgi:hypothetical protein